MRVQENTCIGTAVLLVEDDGSVTKTVTRSEPWYVSGNLIVSVQGKTGGYLASRMSIDTVRDSYV